MLTAAAQGLTADIFEAEVDARAASPAVEAQLALAAEQVGPSPCSRSTGLTAASRRPSGPMAPASPRGWWLAAEWCTGAQALWWAPPPAADVGVSAAQLADAVAGMLSGEAAAEGVQLLDFDHVYPGPAVQGRPTLVLYGDPARSQFHAMHL